MIVDIINSCNGVVTSGGVSTEDIERAEKELGLKFPEEYIEYLKEIGSVYYGPIEWTGLGIEGYLNVVDATRKIREDICDFPSKWFVFENSIKLLGGYVVVNEEGQVGFIDIYDRKIEYMDYDLLYYVKVSLGLNKPNR